MSSKLVLVFNCGSSSIKFALINPESSANLCNGIVQKIAQPDAELKINYNGIKQQKILSNVDYRSALQNIIASIKEQNPELFKSIVAVGHRIVHGGEDFIKSTVIDQNTMTTIKKCVHLAPLHNPANIIGIEEAQNALPNLPHVAVFDTAFHQTMPPYAFIYPIPYEYYQQYKIRRYGFHGTSHRFVSQEAAARLNKKFTDCAFITAHLGNGCSATAILNGASIDTTMGLTPLEGLMMGTRSGDVDPGLHSYLVDNLGIDIKKITEILNKKSGLLGVSGKNSDMREIETAVEQGDNRATLALDMFCYRLAKNIGALGAVLPRLDALVFTGGIGENSPIVRDKTLNWLKILNFAIDKKHNAENGKNNNGIITKPASTIAMVVPTNEELLIAQDTYNLTTH